MYLAIYDVRLKKGYVFNTSYDNFSNYLSVNTIINNARIGVFKTESDARFFLQINGAEDIV